MHSANKEELRLMLAVGKFRLFDRIIVVSHRRYFNILTLDSRNAVQSFC
tara:strand:- start:59369 stop:59515 length:147 start_codon:yes stop_codon:yes gene_type:complete